MVSVHIFITIYQLYLLEMSQLLSLPLGPIIVMMFLKQELKKSDNSFNV